MRHTRQQPYPAAPLDVPRRRPPPLSQWSRAPSPLSWPSRPSPPPPPTTGMSLAPPFPAREVAFRRCCNYQLPTRRRCHGNPRTLWTSTDPPDPQTACTTHHAPRTTYSTPDTLPIHSPTYPTPVPTPFHPPTCHGAALSPMAAMLLQPHDVTPQGGRHDDGGPQPHHLRLVRVDHIQYTADHQRLRTAMMGT